MRPVRAIIRFAVLPLAAVAAMSCGGHNIPESKLEKIFEEIYLTNAYVGNAGYINDSLEYYKPIFEKYGYTTGDLKHTINTFSRRKSSKFTRIIEAARASIDEQYRHYKAGVRNLDHIDSLARARTTVRVFFRDSIRVRRTDDTASLRIEIPVRPGRYTIEYSYMMDTADHNNTMRATHTMFDTLGGLAGATSNNWMNKGHRRHYKIDMEAGLQNENMLRLMLGSYPAKNMRPPHLDIDSVTVTFAPTRAAALDSLDKRAAGAMGRTYLDMYHAYLAQDSLSLLDSLRADAPRGDSLP